SRARLNAVWFFGFLPTAKHQLRYSLKNCDAVWLQSAPSSQTREKVCVWCVFETHTHSVSVRNLSH
ncbi:hypothetical protein, partial [Neptunomonas phycophila]|uniref:hypothetical protein n=1 Tax=Neptunomonas phycophila TaxID=1572645 RepID=UPI003514F160